VTEDEQKDHMEIENLLVIDLSALVENRMEKEEHSEQIHLHMANHHIQKERKIGLATQEKSIKNQAHLENSLQEEQEALQEEWEHLHMANHHIPKKNSETRKHLEIKRISELRKFLETIHREKDSKNR